jgi:hypothetical protein
MAPSISGLTLKLDAPDLRVAVRERLLQIVGLLPGHPIQASGAADEARASGNRDLNLILLDEGIDDLSIQRLIAALREDHRELLVAFPDGGRKGKDLPCEFGSGRYEQGSSGESPIARAAAPFWRAMDRASALRLEIKNICTTNLPTPPQHG